jgi:nitrite reductase (NADH) small subunit
MSTTNTTTTTNTTNTTNTEQWRWTAVCRYDDLIPERGVCALADGQQVAVFRTYEGQLHALSNFDPFGKAFVLSRGIVGTRGGVPTVASPLYKQVFDLRTGQCLDDPAVTIPVVAVRRRDDVVEVRWGP